MTQVQDLGGDEHDRQRDGRLDRRRGNMHDLQRRQRQTDRVGNRERRDGDDQPPAVAHDHDQRQHEQQVIEAGQYVADAEHRVGADDFERARALLECECRAHGEDPRQLLGAVGALHAHQHVKIGGREAAEFDRLAFESARNARAPALGDRAGGVDAVTRADLHRAGREQRFHLERGLGIERRHLPLDVVGFPVDLLQLQIGRAKHVGERRRGEPQCQRGQHGHAGQRGKPPCPRHHSAAPGFAAAGRVASMTTS